MNQWQPEPGDILRFPNGAYLARGHPPEPGGNNPVYVWSGIKLGHAVVGHVSDMYVILVSETGEIWHDFLDDMCFEYGNGEVEVVEV